MHSHYIPRLLLRQFSDNGQTWFWSEKTKQLCKRNIKSVWQQKDLYPEDIETDLAIKIEGPFGDLLNNKLIIPKKHIVLSYAEEWLIRKFFFLLSERNLMTMDSVEDHPNIYDPWQKATAEFVKKIVPDCEYAYTKEEYLGFIRSIINNDGFHTQNLPAIRKHTIASYPYFCSSIALWDCSKTDQEFICSGTSGINNPDYNENMQKSSVIFRMLDLLGANILSQIRDFSLICPLFGIGQYYADWFWIPWTENMILCPISPKRLICFQHPYFRLFFSDPETNSRPRLLPDNIFRMSVDGFREELFAPVTKGVLEQTVTENGHKEKAWYVYPDTRYPVMYLTEEETGLINSLILNESEELICKDTEQIMPAIKGYADNIYDLRYRKRRYDDLEKQMEDIQKETA